MPQKNLITFPFGSLFSKGESPLQTVKVYQKILCGNLHKGLAKDCNPQKINLQVSGVKMDVQIDIFDGINKIYFEHSQTILFYRSEAGNFFCTADRFQPSIIL